MRNDEYNVLVEESKPKDEPATLDEALERNADKALGKKNGTSIKKAQKMKKEMLNKSAGLAVGAVAVVMVASTLKVKEEVPYSYTCPICAVENCELWKDYAQEEVTRVSLENDGYFVPKENEHHMGLDEETEKMDGVRTSVIHMQDGRRAYIKSISTEYINYDTMFDTRCDNRNALWPEAEMAVRDINCWSDLSDRENVKITNIELIYMPDGARPQEENLYEEVNGEFIADLPYVYMQPVQNEDKLWLRISSTEESIDLESMWEDVDVRIVGRDVNSFYMGNTMVFCEDSMNKRTWFEDAISVQNMGWGAPNYSLQYEFETVCYDFIGANSTGERMYYYDIQFTSADYEAIYSEQKRLNELAEERGHNVYAPIYQLEEYECNGITYETYIWGKEGRNSPIYELVCSPIQEKNCAIKMQIDSYMMEGKVLKEGLGMDEILTMEELEDIERILKCIYLKEDIPSRFNNVSEEDT